MNNIKNKELSTIVCEAFLSLNYPFDISKASMWSLEDPYIHPPFFRFKIGGDKPDLVFEKLKNIITNFNGGLVWGLYKNEYTCLLLPEIFSIHIDSNLYDKKFMIQHYGGERYKDLVDMAITDTIALATLIRKGEFLDSDS